MPLNSTGRILLFLSYIYHLQQIDSKWKRVKNLDSTRIGLPWVSPIIRLRLIRENQIIGDSYTNNSFVNLQRNFFWNSAGDSFGRVPGIVLTNLGDDVLRRVVNKNINRHFEFDVVGFFPSSRIYTIYNNRFKMKTRQKPGFYEKSVYVGFGRNRYTSYKR